MIQFVSAAFGKFYRNYAAKGLCETFHKYVPEGHLTIFVDKKPKWRPPKNCSLIPLPKKVQEHLQNCDKSFFATTSVKFDLLKQIINKYDEPVCWLDADSLVLYHLPSILNINKINFVSHGSCHPDEKFDCGNGVIVKGNKFAIGCIFLLPSKDIVTELLALANERNTWKPDKNAYWFSDGEQSLLNHLVKRYPENISWIDQSGLIANLSYTDGRHPYPTDLGVQGIHLEDGVFYSISHKKIALLAWTSLTLRLHIKQGFRSMDPIVATIFRKQFYKLNSFIFSVPILKLYNFFDAMKNKLFP